MARFFGLVGFAEAAVQDPPGVWKEPIVEHTYLGEVIRNSRGLQETEQVTNDITVGVSISIVADAYASQNFVSMRYVAWMGTLWIVSNVDVQSPRLILRLGGKYNGPTA